MAQTFALELTTPEQVFFSAPATQVSLLGGDGMFGVLAGHAPIISTLQPGVVEIEAANNENKSIFVAGGFAEVTPEKCVILADEAYAISDLNQEEIEERKKKAEHTLRRSENNVDLAKAEKELAITEAMLELV